MKQKDQIDQLRQALAEVLEALEDMPLYSDWQPGSKRERYNRAIGRGHDVLGTRPKPVFRTILCDSAA